MGQVAIRLASIPVRSSLELVYVDKICPRYASLKVRVAKISEGECFYSASGYT
jgi:hypothetical protein